MEIQNNKNKRVEFGKKNVAEFYPAVRQRVDEYFEKNNISRHANSFMIFKTAFILTGFGVCYALILSNTLSPWVLLGTAGIFGFFTGLIGLNIAHDAIHGAYSSNTKLNRKIGVLFNLAGANDYLWKIKHNIIHHTYTNIPDHDDDIVQAPIIRMDPTQELWWIHRFQHFYIFLLYPLTSITWVFMKDYKNFFRKQFGPYDMSNHPKREIFRLFFYKIFYYVVFIVIPLIVIDLPWYSIMAGFVFMHIVEGLLLSLVFQLAHVVEGTEFPEPDTYGKIENTWATHQMYTTADFARKSWLANFLFGGLNYQIEHHLFPKVCHVHYRNISPIVEQTAKEYGLPFIENRTFGGAILSHVRMMKQFGRA